MDIVGLILAVLLAVAVVGQLCLPLVGHIAAKKRAHSMAMRRARLLEDAADQQAAASYSQAGNVSRTSYKGIPDADH